MKKLLSSGWKFNLPFSVKKSFKMASELGFDGLELVLNSEYIFHKAGYIKKLSKEYNVPILSVHCPIIAMPFSWPLKYWLDKTFRIAQKLGAKIVVIHPPFMKVYYSKIGLSLIDYLKKKDKQYPEIKITLENFRYAKKNKFNNLEDLKKTLEQYKFNLTLDTTHIGFTDYDLLSAYRIFRDQIINIHFSDWKSYREHLVPGTGTLPLKELLKELKKDNYPDFITLELMFSPFISTQKSFNQTKEAISFINKHYA